MGTRTLMTFITLSSLLILAGCQTQKSATTDVEGTPVSTKQSSDVLIEELGDFKTQSVQTYNFPVEYNSFKLTTKIDQLKGDVQLSPDGFFFGSDGTDVDGWLRANQVYDGQGRVIRQTENPAQGIDAISPRGTIALSRHAPGSANEQFPFIVDYFFTKTGTRIPARSEKNPVNYIHGPFSRGGVIPFRSDSGTTGLIKDNGEIIISSAGNDRTNYVAIKDSPLLVASEEIGEFEYRYYVVSESGKELNSFGEFNEHTVDYHYSPVLDGIEFQVKENESDLIRTTLYINSQGKKIFENRQLGIVGFREVPFSPALKHGQQLDKNGNFAFMIINTKGERVDGTADVIAYAMSPFNKFGYAVAQVKNYDGSEVSIVVDTTGKELARGSNIGLYGDWLMKTVTPDESVSGKYYYVPVDHNLKPVIDEENISVINEIAGVTNEGYVLFKTAENKEQFTIGRFQ